MTCWAPGPRQGPVRPSHQTGRKAMAHVPIGLAASMLLLLAPLTAFGQPVPDGLSVEWQGKKPCEKLYEDAQILIVRCTIPPGGKHVKHFHPGFSSYVLSGGKAQIED